MIVSLNNFILFFFNFTIMLKLLLTVKYANSNYAIIAKM